MGDEYTHENLQVVGIHEPDYQVERLGDGTSERRELPGVYRVGVVIDGVFAEITSFKAGLLTNSAATAQKARAEQARQADAEQASGEPPPAQGQSASQ